MSAQYVIGTVAGQCVAIDARAVESVIDIAGITPVALAPVHVVGLGAVRSVVLTVIDVAAAIGLDSDSAAVRSAIVTLDGHRYALRMTRIDDVITTDAVVQPVDESVGPGWHAASTGRIATPHGLALIVDPARLVGATGVLAPAPTH